MMHDDPCQICGLNIEEARRQYYRRCVTMVLRKLPTGVNGMVCELCYADCHVDGQWDMDAIGRRRRWIAKEREPDHPPLYVPLSDFQKAFCNPDEYRKEKAMTEEKKPARRIVWQKDDIRLIAEGTKAVAMEKCFKDELGNDMWKDSPNWHAEILAQALVDCDVLNHLEDYRPTLARIETLETAQGRIFEAVEDTQRRVANLAPFWTGDSLRRLESLEKKVRLLDAHSASLAVTDSQVRNSLASFAVNHDDDSAKFERKLKKLRKKVARLEDDLDALITSQPGARSNG
jgi:hypothetical protein